MDTTTRATTQVPAPPGLPTGTHPDTQLLDAMEYQLELADQRASLATQLKRATTRAQNLQVELDTLDATAAATAATVDQLRAQRAERRTHSTRVP